MHANFYQADANIVTLIEKTNKLKHSHLNTQGLGEAFDAFALLGKTWVDIEVQSCGDGRVAKDGGDGLVVALALNAPRGKTVS